MQSEPLPRPAGRSHFGGRPNFAVPRFCEMCLGLEGDSLDSCVSKPFLVVKPLNRNRQSRRPDPRLRAPPRWTDGGDAPRLRQPRPARGHRHSRRGRSLAPPRPADGTRCGAAHRSRGGAHRAHPRLSLTPNSPQLGSIPLDLSTPAPTGPVTYWMSALAAAGSLLAGPMPAAKTVTLFKSPGSGPTNRAPAMGTISDA